MNHISQHAFEAAQQGECRNSTLRWPKKDDLSEMPGFLSGGLIILISGEASMLSTSIMKMFHLWMFANLIWRNDIETV